MLIASNLFSKIFILHKFLSNFKSTFKNEYANSRAYCYALVVSSFVVFSKSFAF
jgi:hypothetical protein